MQIINATRAYEDVYLEDPAENPQTPSFRVWLDDESIEGMLGKVADAIDRAQAIDRMSREAAADGERAEAVKALARLQKRVISAIIGADGYRTVLEWMGDGEAVDPEKHVRQLGEVFAALLTMLGRKATSEQLRACGAYYTAESRKTTEFMAAQRASGRQQSRAAKGGKKRRK